VLHPLLLLAWCCWQRSKEAKAKRARSERAKKRKKEKDFAQKKAGLKKSSRGTLWILNFKTSFQSLKIIFEIFDFQNSNSRDVLGYTDLNVAAAKE
jgi:hypothetical protein